MVGLAEYLHACTLSRINNVSIPGTKVTTTLQNGGWLGQRTAEAEG